MGCFMIEKIEKLQLVWLAVILALGLIFAVRLASSNFSKEGIKVTGSAYEVVQSDSGRLEFEISARKTNKSDAYKLVQSQLPVVLDYLQDKGIPDADIEIKTSNGYNSYKYNSNGNATNDIAYYNLSQPVAVKSQDVQKIKELSTGIQSLLDKGIDINVSQPEYFYTKLSDLKVKLLQNATKDAKQRASAMLKATHNRAGKIQSVQMGVFQITPTDSTNVSDMGINDTTTIEKKVTAVANVVFQIK